MIRPMLLRRYSALWQVMHKNDDNNDSHARTCGGFNHWILPEKTLKQFLSCCNASDMPVHAKGSTTITVIVTQRAASVLLKLPASVTDAGSIGRKQRLMWQPIDNQLMLEWIITDAVTTRASRPYMR